ncbi:hypothetical protein GCM10022247_53110 [Allokutzneria multivorans]|uniref:Uncharacterized protein n=1 Tax=Allokutzneria multivorans TaxID=1142134 RepID=A0ABP7T7P5_9PSEU
MPVKTQLRWASAVMIVIGAGHLVLAIVLAWDSHARWLDQGLWASVPLMGGALDNEVAFWAALGSFSVPQILLGWVLWHLAGRGVTVPAGVGWVYAAWCVLGGILLVPSPFFVGVVPGLLIVSAARNSHERSRG